MKKISIDQFDQERILEKQAQFLDVRERPEHAERSLEGFILSPLSGLSEMSVKALDKARPTYLLCRSGKRACQAGERLEMMGFKDLRIVEGGLGAWEAAGKPVIRGVPKVWSLERQVRFSAGTLVALGIVLSMTAHAAAIYLSLFVAAGLIFSALTDTCGMGMILAKCPWNQK